MRREERGCLIGMVLGDGNISKVRKSVATFRCRHAFRQKEYAKYKMEKIHSIFGGNKPKLIDFDNSGYPGVRFSKTHRYFRILRRWIYPNNVKTISRKVLNYLSDEGIAIWYMDDGSYTAKRRKDGKIHAMELHISTYIPWEQNELIIDFFKEKYDISFTQVRDRQSYRLRCGTKESRKFIDLVSPYILPSMLYKIQKARAPKPSMG